MRWMEVSHQLYAHQVREKGSYHQIYFSFQLNHIFFCPIFSEILLTWRWTWYVICVLYCINPSLSIFSPWQASWWGWKIVFFRPNGRRCTLWIILLRLWIGLCVPRLRHLSSAMQLLSTAAALVITVPNYECCIWTYPIVESLFFLQTMKIRHTYWEKGQLIFSAHSFHTFGVLLVMIIW